MGCSPSVLLEHIHRDSSTNQDKRAIKKQTPLPCANSKKEGNRVVRRKSSLPLTPEDELLDIYKIHHDTRYKHLLPPNRNPLLLLAVFTQVDATSETLIRAGEKLGFDTTLCDSYEKALDEFQSKSHDLILIDTRCSKLDYDTLCRSIRNTKGSQHIVVAAIVKKSVFEKDDVAVASLLESGFTRCIIETTNIVAWVNELTQLKHSDVRPMAQYATCQALYTALDKCKDLILISDDSCRLQYINCAGEVLFGYRHEEVMGKSIQEQLVQDPAQMNTLMSKLTRSRIWQGPLTFKRKSQEPITLGCQAAPIHCGGKAPTHYVIVIDSTGTTGYTYESLPQSRGSIHSARRGSTDVRSIGSEYFRRTSLAKLSALPLEAPITKIVTLITQAQENSSSNQQIVSLLDKALDILRNTELYTTHVREDPRFKSEEPVTTDLIGALLSNTQQITTLASRRSSNDSTLFRVATRPSKIKVPAQIKELLESSLLWDFNIMCLEDLTNRRPLLHLGFNLFTHFDVAGTLNCDERTLYNFLILIESNYHTTNTYHNSTHAADVMQAIAVYLERDRLKAIMDPLDEATALIAAGCHDIDHPGRSSAFLCNSGNALAILYNDITVLESHHSALTFKLALADDRVNIFKNLDKETYKIARQNIVDMILATEMTKHFEHLAKFVNSFSKPSNDSDDASDVISITSPETMTLVKRMMIKCADVSNPARPLVLCVEWSRRITEEYFQQTDEEKAKGLPVLMPMFDRSTCSIPKAQIGFVDFIINDMVEAWNAFIDFPEMVTNMRQNYLKWKEFDEQGFTTLADIKKLQATILAPIKSTPTVNE